jgi:hypothetical protein
LSQKGVSKTQAIHGDDLIVAAKSLLDQLKTLANKRDVPYQTLLMLFLLRRK